MKQGASDFLLKPVELNRLRRLVGEALDVARRSRELVALADDVPYGSS